ncbi:hypothetical protein [Streptomyces beigongshangae]|uniref:hypothetical protein n=1 Tax=Streptomyces beigongshangae TaxID=2841597 RepID=UPI001C8520FC|nr:hypothetical protein [Streptomyces sp. REN17]
MQHAVVDFMEELVTQPRRQHSFRRSPEAYIAGSALSRTEREAVASGDVSRMRAVLAEYSPVKEEAGGLLILLAFDEEESGEGGA